MNAHPSIYAEGSRARFLLHLLICCALVGCSGSPGAAPSGDGFQHDVVLTMSLTVPPGQELHQCQFAALPGGDGIDAVALSHRYTQGSHHFVVISTDLDSIPPDMTGQYDCTNGNEPIMAHARGVLYGGQSPTGYFPLPDGVTFHFKPNEVVILQAHYLNVSANPVDAKIEFGIDAAKSGAGQQQAGFMFFYDPFIYLPPLGTASSGLRCLAPQDLQIISAQSHYHQRGTGMKVYLDSPDSEASQPFFETHDWEHPNDFHGPFAVPAGSHIRFQCDYANTEASEILEGPNAKTSEMCVFGGLYYPKIDDNFENCRPLSVLGTGTETCGDLVSCVRACAPQPSSGPLVPQACLEKCIEPGCQGAGDLLLTFLGCVNQMCQSDCAAGQCETCATTQCADSFQACTQQTCGP
jgi:hypothetical protein